MSVRLPNVGNPLATKCRWCRNTKYAIQYTGFRVEHPSTETEVIHPDHPGVCLVCPRCDSPGVAE